jgi:hypothetical protein
MDGDIVERMRTEEADLMRKLVAVRGFLAAYGEAPAKAVRQESQNSKTGGSREKVSLEAFGDYGRATVMEAMKVLLLVSHPVKTRSIVDTLQAQGYHINGESPINALGALLARSADIVSHGKKGWSLADPEKARDILGAHAHNENEAANGAAVAASEASGFGVPPPNPFVVKPNPWPAA